MKRDRWTAAAAALLVLLAIVRLATVAAGPLALSPDEAHYWEWSRRPALGYYSKGPLVAWLIALSTHVLGDGEFGVRAPAVLLALATGLVGVRFSLDAFGRGRAAFLAVLVASSMPLLAAGAMLMTIDAPFAFCWMLAAWTLWRATGAPPAAGSAWWLACGAALGLGLLAKPTMALFVPSAAIALVVAGRARPRTADVALAAAAAALLVSPLVGWNAAHGWVSLRHVVGQAGLAGDAGRSGLATAADFVGSQLGVVSPGLVAATIVALIARRGPGDGAARRFLLGLSLPTIAFFLLWSFHSKVQANWAAAGWLGVSIALGAAWDADLVACASEPARRRRHLLAAAALAPGVACVLLLHVPDSPRTLGLALPARLDPTSRLRGWRELGAAAGALATREHPPLALAAASYQTTSELAFYVPGRPVVADLDLGDRRRNQHDLWGDARSLAGRDVLFVADGPWREAPAELARRCAAIELVATIVTVAPTSARDPGRASSIFRCAAYRPPVAAAPPGRY